MAGNAAESGRTVTSKVSAILMAFSRGSTHSLTELAKLTGLPVSTTHRLANELAARRLLERTEDGAYRIGLPLRMIGATTREGTRIAAAALPAIWGPAAAVMADLAAATRSPARLGTLDGTVVLEASSRPGAGTSEVAVSDRPVQSTALGRTLLAFSPAPVAEQLLGGTPMPVALRHAIGVTRLTHVALVRGGTGGAVAMPVFGAGGALLAALELGVADLCAGLAGARAALTVATGSLSRMLATAPATEAELDGEAV
jgi:DNA-binding IclR family transcriptional regulator